MAKSILDIENEGYVGELFPLVFASPAYDPTWKSILCHECTRDHTACQDRVTGICKHYEYTKPCLFSNCNLWRYIEFGIKGLEAHDLHWVSVEGRQYTGSVRSDG